MFTKVLYLACFTSKIDTDRTPRVKSPDVFWGAPFRFLLSQIPTDNAIVICSVPADAAGGKTAPLSPLVMQRPRSEWPSPMTTLATNNNQCSGVRPGRRGARGTARPAQLAAECACASDPVGRAVLPSARALRQTGVSRRRWRPRARGAFAWPFRATDATTSGGSGAGHLGLGRDVWQAGRRGRFMCFFKFSISGQGHVFSA